jgi:hypothetical protein
MAGETSPKRCGICTRAPRMDDPMGGYGVRVTAEDLTAGGHAGKEPGLYEVCAECKAVYKPILAKRLHAEGVLASPDPAAMPDGHMH